MKLSNNYISLAGEFAVLSQLALRGIDANMTLGNTKSVDIIAADPKTGGMFKLEVKTSYNNKPSNSELFGRTLHWIMGQKHETIADPDLYYCFVIVEKDTHSFRFFIVPNNVVAKYVRIQHQYWLDLRKGPVNSTTVRQFRLGVEEDGYSIETPLASEYENRWDFLPIPRD